MQSAPDFQKDQVDQKDRLEMQNAMLSELAIFAVTPGAMAGRGAAPVGQGKAGDAGADWAAVLAALEAEGQSVEPSEAAEAIAEIVAAVGEAAEDMPGTALPAEEADPEAETAEGRAGEGEVGDTAEADLEAAPDPADAAPVGRVRSGPSEAPSSLVEMILGAVEARKATEAATSRPEPGTDVGGPESMSAPVEHRLQPVRGEALPRTGPLEALATVPHETPRGAIAFAEAQRPVRDPVESPPERRRMVAVHPQKGGAVPASETGAPMEARLAASRPEEAVVPLPEAAPMRRGVGPQAIPPGWAGTAQALPEQAAQAAHDGPAPEAIARGTLPPKLEARRADTERGDRAPPVAEVTRPPVAAAGPIVAVDPAPVATQPVAADAVPLVQDVRAASAPTGMPGTPVPQPTAATAQAVAMQIAEISRPLPDGPIELSLQPEELGRLKLSFSGGEAGLHIVVAAERPETLEMMRRNIEVLAQEMRRLGHEGAQFSFAGGEGNLGQRMQGEGQPGEWLGWADDTARPAAAAATPPVPLQGFGQAGLDLRL